MTDEPRRRRPMARIGDLIPDAAARLGLADELQLARAIATFDAIVAEFAPAAYGACRATRIEGAVLFVEADAPIVAQEVRLRTHAILRAFAQTATGSAVTELRIAVRRA